MLKILKDFQTKSMKIFLWISRTLTNIEHKQLKNVYLGASVYKKWTEMNEQFVNSLQEFLYLCENGNIPSIKGAKKYLLGFF